MNPNVPAPAAVADQITADVTRVLAEFAVPLTVAQRDTLRAIVGVRMEQQQEAMHHALAKTVDELDDATAHDVRAASLVRRLRSLLQAAPAPTPAKANRGGPRP